ncbi:ABC transporter substrate-binding protein [Gordonia sp. zg691]|uniref:ABC transporter substrate-binding protein n=1 Tax=Gordonia jinghuaiqii TaxID=2758710 RepID=A0A7D7QHY7_9ACTN|nr:ABC transporter substrate-binding protein [Gordonia jinghuaiqii]MBD0861276.1 ABC transporter substrate-binding protein [Gordonia jinghuaiqii]MCR5976183.1 ABC transporter substrate-binding protein [Gordonia jinghuaiqii]QMT03422.1 ABC transporter substrate-binding protein [Gordonia jinghuaiqii]
MGSRPLRALSVVLLTVLTVSGCFVTPIEQDRHSPGAHLRSGPQTATLSQTDVIPVADNPQPRLPATVESVRYGRVTVTDASRIVAVDINGTLGNTVFALGLGSRVVGRDTSTAFPSAVSRPVVTNRGHSLDAEAVLALAPTVVLVSESTVPTTAVDQIRASGIAVVVFPAIRDLASNDALMRRVAAALGVRDEGEKLIARTDSQVEAARELVPDLSGDPTMAFLYIRGRNLLLLAGPGSGADDLIESLGGDDAGAAADLTGAFTAISAEAMITADPDVIIVMTQGADTVGGPEGVMTLPGVEDTEAGRHGRIVQMDESKILAFGPDVGLVLAALAKSIYT